MKSIDGVTIVTKDNVTICKIDSISDDLKKIIRSELAAIVHGKSAITTTPELYSYKNTLSNFLAAYKSKSSRTKKGMIGELLTHVLLGRFHPHLSSISILKNKEENSIKKGFDLIYCDMKARSFWYSEVKAGKKNAKHTVQQANTVLLNRAHTGMKNMFTKKGRDKLWDSALGDVAYVLDGKKKSKISTLLSKESPILKPALAKEKNVILVSVLYDPKQAALTYADVEKFIKTSTHKAAFKNILICSIQKGTYRKVAEFLKAEAA